MEALQNTKYHTHITAKHKWYELNMKEVWQYRDLDRKSVV